MASASIKGGSSFWMRGQNNIDTQILAARLYKRGVLIEPGMAFFSQQRRKLDLYRLAFSSIPPAKIPEGIAIIAQEIRKELAPRNRTIAQVDFLSDGGAHAGQ